MTHVAPRPEAVAVEALALELRRRFGMSTVVEITPELALSILWAVDDAVYDSAPTWQKWWRRGCTG